MLELVDVSKKVGREAHIDAVSLGLESGTLNVLLGPTLSGKTSLMRLMAGLDRPTSGRIIVNNEDVTGLAVQHRNVAMVYQQFINYPAMTVYENIASPLRVARTDKSTLDAKVREAAELMRLTPYLDRTPLTLSGGQQQRTALARALVKGADLVLLDEPLANLDYKLREELRAELPRIFAETGAVFVYATTEPAEALLLGGNTVALSEGRVTQFGPTIDVYKRPADLLTAQTFSDPPLNTIRLTKARDRFLLDASTSLPVPIHYADLADGDYLVGFRPHHLYLEAPSDRAVALKATVAVSEITGSESYIHLDFADERWVALAHGVHALEVDEVIDVYVDPSRFFVFHPDGSLATGDSRQAA